MPNGSKSGRFAVTVETPATAVPPSATLLQQLVAKKDAALAEIGRQQTIIAQVEADIAQIPGEFHHMTFHEIIAKFEALFHLPA